MKTLDTVCTWYSGWDLHDGNCYRVYAIERSWPQALVVCGRYGSQLARVEDPKTNEFVGRQARKLLRPRARESATYWIGLFLTRFRFRGSFSSSRFSLYSWMDYFNIDFLVFHNVQSSKWTISNTNDVLANFRFNNTANARDRTDIFMVRRNVSITIRRILGLGWTQLL